MWMTVGINAYAVPKGMQKFEDTHKHIQLELMTRWCKKPCTWNMLHSVLTAQECHITRAHSKFSWAADN